MSMLEIGVKMTQEELNQETINLINQGFDIESGKIVLRGDKDEIEEVVKQAYLKLVYSNNECAQETSQRIGERRKVNAAEKAAAEKAIADAAAAERLGVKKGGTK